jgi:chemotaxis methyl-accepting protein methylase
MEKKIGELVEFLSVSHGIDISGYDGTFVKKAIDRRLTFHDHIDLNKYLTLLTSNSKEVDELIDSLHISFSEFFRNPLTFACLEQNIVPLLLARKQKQKQMELRIWSAACASGQEAYSMAILLDEMNCNRIEKFNFRIFATDNNPDELRKAERGHFSAANLNKVTLQRFQTYFSGKDENFDISPRLLEYLDFSYFDLLDDQRSCPAPSIYGNFDIIFCSNLLFYYKPASRQRILEKIGNTLASGGFLVTGETERDILTKNNFREVFANSAIFQKNIKTSSVNSSNFSL